MYLTKGIAKKNDGSITIKPKQIGHLPGLTEPDVFKTLQQIPGVISVDESISNINIRGGTPRPKFGHLEWYSVVSNGAFLRNDFGFESESGA